MKIIKLYYRAEDAKKTNNSVIPAIIKAYGLPFVFAGFMKLVVTAMVFAQPFILDKLIDFTSEVKTAPMWQGLILASALFCVTFLSVVVDCQHFYIARVTSFRIRTGLMSAIYRKALRISAKVKKDIAVGKIFNLMSVDTLACDELSS